MSSKIYPTSRRTNIVLQRVKDELLIYDLKINKAYCLNETAAQIYQLCDGNNSISDISKLMDKQLNQPVSEHFIAFALEQLKKDNLLENAREIKTGLEDSSRREIIKKLGIASMIALPVVASLIAPTAVSAQSETCLCVNPGNCLTKTKCPSTVNCNLSGQCAP